MNAMIWTLPVLLPLVAAAAVLLPLRGRGWVLVVAPVPALALGLLGAPERVPDLSWLLLDVRLHLDPLSRVLLVMTALVWSAAGAHARLREGNRKERPDERRPDERRPDERRSGERRPDDQPGKRLGPGEDHGFASLFLLTMAGNLGLLLAGDAASFYALFALMTFAAYGLVVHDRTPRALRAGRVYIALAILGEVAIFSGLVLAVQAAGSTELAALGPAIATATDRDLIVALLLAGFGVKAGVVPLHVWLPLAHPAAPVPASAVLSGTMIKAGLVGWLRVLPLGDVELGAWSVACVVIGILTAYAAIAVGLTQRDAKANLAYSSISQMGVIIVLIGVAFGAPDGASLAVTAAVVYAVHHGFAKSALFLGVGVARGESDPARHRVLLIGMGVAALSLAGLPLTSGALAKITLKDAVGLLSDDWAAVVTLLLSVAAVGTTLLMGRLLHLVSRPADAGTASPAVVVPWCVVLAAVAVATWLLPSALIAGVDPPALYIGVLWDGVWPVLLGAAVLLVARHAHQRWHVTIPEVPPGDAVVVLEAVGRSLGTGWRQTVSPRAARTAGVLRGARHVVYLAMLPGGGVDRLDRRLTRWRTAGALLVVIAVVLLYLLGRSG
jgi:formate hydrogenlyase subunit 3/multisubunit Na+/H+ antiporter MnhD subunit